MGCEPVSPLSVPILLGLAREQMAGLELADYMEALGVRVRAFQFESERFNDLTENVAAALEADARMIRADLELGQGAFDVAA